MLHHIPTKLFNKNKEMKKMLKPKVKTQNNQYRLLLMITKKNNPNIECLKASKSGLIYNSPKNF